MSSVKVFLLMCVCVCVLVCEDSAIEVESTKSHIYWCCTYSGANIETALGQSKTTHTFFNFTKEFKIFKLIYKYLFWQSQQVLNKPMILESPFFKNPFAILHITFLLCGSGSQKGSSRATAKCTYVFPSSPPPITLPPQQTSK